MVPILLSDQTLVFEFGSICVKDRQVGISDCQIVEYYSVASFGPLYLIFCITELGLSTRV